MKVCTQNNCHKKASWNEVLDVKHVELLLISAAMSYKDGPQAVENQQQREQAERCFKFKFHDAEAPRIWQVQPNPDTVAGSVHQHCHSRDALYTVAMLDLVPQNE